MPVTKKTKRTRKCGKLIEIPCELLTQVKALARINGRFANSEIEAALQGHVRKYREKLERGRLVMAATSSRT